MLKPDLNTSRTVLIWSCIAACVIVLEHKSMLMNHGREIRLWIMLRDFSARENTSLPQLSLRWLIDWLTDEQIFFFLHCSCCHMQRSTPMLKIPTLQLFAYYESWNILAGNSKRPKVHTFFIWFIFPAAAWRLNKTNYSPPKGAFLWPHSLWNERRLQSDFLSPLNKRWK